MSIPRRTAIFGAAALLGGCALGAPSTVATPAPVTFEPDPTYPELPSQGPTPLGDPTPSLRSPDPTPSSVRPSSAKPSSAKPATTQPRPTQTLPTGGTLATGTNHSSAANAYAYTGANVQTWLRGQASAPKKLAFVTFDDGPNTTTTPRMLDTLKALGVPATFFTVGKQLASCPNWVPKRAIAEGHAVCLHSYSHDYALLYPGRSGNTANIMADFDRALSAARSALGSGYGTTAYRYPGGHMSWSNLAGADAALKQRGVTWIDWNCMSGDADKSRPSTADGMVALLTRELVAAGEPRTAVMLNHDSAAGNLTMQALPQLVRVLRDRGYSFGVIG